jgi:outer membrane autotransporter protein
VLGANGRISGTNLTVTTSGQLAAGAEADNGGSIQLSGGSVTTLNNGSIGLLATNGGQISAAGVNISTQGVIAYGALAQTGSVITLQNSNITVNGLGTNGLFVSGAGSSISLTNSNVLSTQGSGASVDNGASLTLSGSSLTALVHGIVATRGTASAPNSIVVSGGNLITVLGDAFQVQNGATNITVSNGASVTGNSALLRVLPLTLFPTRLNAAIGTYAAGVPLFYADMDTLIERLGELRLLAGDGSASADSSGKAIIPPAPPVETSPTIGTWVRGFGNGMHINDQVSRAYDQNTGGFQLGADKRFNALHGDLYIGGFLSYFNASRDFLDGGNGATNALSLGTYATWINPKGWYADLVFKYTQLWNYFNAPSDGGTSTGFYSIPSLGGSLEVGKRFDFGKFFVEPQAQLAGVWEAGNNYTTSNGLIVGGSDEYSLRGRLGLRAGMHFALSNGIEIEPYLKVSAVHEFLTGDRITVNETGFNPTISGTLVDAGAGITARVSQSVYLYGEYDYANDDRIRQPWAVNAGVRWQWGGKSEQAAVVAQPSVKQSTGKQAEAEVVEQPPQKTTGPWEITVGGPV